MSRQSSGDHRLLQGSLNTPQSSHSLLPNLWSRTLLPACQGSVRPMLLGWLMAVEVLCQALIAYKGRPINRNGWNVKSTTHDIKSRAHGCVCLPWGEWIAFVCMLWGFIRCYHGHGKHSVPWEKVFCILLSDNAESLNQFEPSVAKQGRFTAALPT